ncbi:hypothetical protein L3Q82_022699, partial [Scortum barcoo]
VKADASSLQELNVLDYSLLLAHQPLHPDELEGKHSFANLDSSYHKQSGEGGNMDVVPTCYCTLLDRKSQSKFICYTRRTDGLFAVCLTDAADVWSSEFTEDSSEQFRQRFALRSTEDFIPKLRSGCVSGSVSAEVNGSSAELHVGSPPGALSVILSRLEGPQASRELKELLFRMADSLTQPDSKCTLWIPLHHACEKSPKVACWFASRENIHITY